MLSTAKALLQNVIEISFNKRIANCVNYKSSDFSNKLFYKQ